MKDIYLVRNLFQLIKSPKCSLLQDPNQPGEA